MSDQAKTNQPPEQVAENEVAVHEIYNCIYCDRSFNSSQALAGHCKSHRNDIFKSLQKPAPEKGQEPIFKYQMLSGPNVQYPQYYQHYAYHALSQSSTFYEPYTHSIRVTTRPIADHFYDHGSSSNGKENSKEELDLTLRL
ncbi:uncharacterized protein A4U43_C10F18500 [Asparagus officinalis]|uniref:C2H2-type domain-containing protein n=1 Tax=Asparagus officinalis TaxID=4686 RepID=A0A5P1E756_ASPOF|nr:uncharacterized protein A4U43_C10F18500 [Asparagus officinalis]